VQYDVEDPRVRQQLLVARAWGVPMSVFLGRVVDPALGIPQWLEADRQAAMDLAQYESELCPGCHQPLAETTLAENEFRYKPMLELRCHRCTTLDQVTNAMQSRPSPSALLIPIELRPALDEPEVDTKTVE
jgi:hypothetical protein